MLFHSPCDFESDPGEDDFVIFDQSATATIYISFSDIDFSSSMHFAFIRKCACGATKEKEVFQVATATPNGHKNLVYSTGEVTRWYPSVLDSRN